LKLDPSNSAALYAIASLQLANGRESDALRTLRELDRLQVKAPEVYMQYGTLLALHGEFPLAIRAANRALALDSSLDAARTLLALAREGESVGGKKGVAAIRNRVEKLRVDWTLHAARMQLEKGEYERARDLFERALRAAPSDSRVLYGLGYTLLENQRFEEAAQAFRRMLQLDPKSVSGTNALAYTDAVMGVNLQEAKRRVLAVLPDSKDLHPYLLDTLGWICYREGDASEALSYLQEAETKLPPADRSMRAENRFHIAAALSHLGRKEEARRYLGMALKEASGEFWVPELKALQKNLEG
jgi:Flp pilus assembly protein TadD